MSFVLLCLCRCVVGVSCVAVVRFGVREWWMCACVLACTFTQCVRCLACFDDRSWLWHTAENQVRLFDAGVVAPVLAAMAAHGGSAETVTAGLKVFWGLSAAGACLPRHQRRDAVGCEGCAGSLLGVVAATPALDCAWLLASDS